MDFISVGLWGSQDRYLIGFLRLCKSVIYAPIKLSLYCHVEAATYELLCSSPEWRPFHKFLFHHSIHYIVVPEHEGWMSTFWRFRLLDSNYRNSVGIPHLPLSLHFRDVDSLLLLKEFDVLRLWKETCTIGLIIRDHPAHYSWPIMAGLWSVHITTASRQYYDSLFEFLSSYPGSSDQYFSDQMALKQAYQSFSINSYFFEARLDNSITLFPANNKYRYIGEPVDPSLAVDISSLSKRLSLFSPSSINLYHSHI